MLPSPRVGADYQEPSRIPDLERVQHLYIMALPIIGGAIVSMVIGDLPPRELVIVIATMLLLWGSIDVWEGIAGVRSRRVAEMSSTMEPWRAGSPYPDSSLE